MTTEEIARELRTTLRDMDRQRRMMERALSVLEGRPRQRRGENVVPIKGKRGPGRPRKAAKAA